MSSSPSSSNFSAIQPVIWLFPSNNVFAVNWFTFDYFVSFAPLSLGINDGRRAIDVRRTNNARSANDIQRIDSAPRAAAELDKEL